GLSSCARSPDQLGRVCLALRGARLSIVPQANAVHFMSPRTIGRLIGGALVIFVLIIAAASSNYVVQPGYRGVQVTLGKVSPVFKPEGFGFKLPFISAVVPQSIRQQTAKFEADCYSSDLQQVKIDVRVLYRVPQASVV